MRVLKNCLKKSAFIIVLFFVNCSIGFGQTSTGNGEWATVVFSTVTNGEYLIENDNIVNIHHIVSSDLRISVESGGSLNIGNDGDADIDSLTINGDLFLGDTTDITVYEDGVLYIDGDLTNWDGTITVNGTLKVTGDADNFTSNIIVGPNGFVGVAGDFDNTGGSIDNSGDVWVGGSFSGGSVTGNAVDDSKTPEEVLPIKLIYFYVYHNGNNVVIKWQTASEENNDYFTIERSADGVNFKTIGTITGAGNSYASINYSFTDKNPVYGISYYRLKQTDYNGVFKVFNVVSVSYLNKSSIKIGPNPATKELNIIIDGDMGTGIVKLYNTTGAIVKRVELTSSYAKLNINDLPVGNYMVVISANDYNFTKMVIVQ